MTDLNQHEDIHASVDEGYLLDVNDVAELLGVTRTRVSQLTSNGLLSFERRRVGLRNRLFYKRSEVIAYQKTYYGRHVALPQRYSPEELNSEFQGHPTLSKGVHESRAGASGASSPRTQILAPETLLLETARLSTHEQNNALMLVRIQETLNQWMSKQTSQTKPQVRSAIEIEEAEQTSKKLQSLSRDIKELASRIDRQNSALESLSLGLAAVMKEIHHLAVEQRKAMAKPTLSAPEQIQSPPALHAEILVHKRPRPKTRIQTTVKKRILSR